MIDYLHRCMVVPAAYAPTVRALCSGMAPGGSGSGMFLAGLSPSGNAPATHFISCGSQGDEFSALLPLAVFDAEGNVTITAGHPETIVTLAKQAGSTITLAQINGILAACDITEQSWQEACARLGLQQVRGALP
ncbi:MAG: hypothetical protein JWR74_1192 [Polaromonas sp.]|nr:hypothetical protein [Polaromonas sp.]